MTTEYHKIQTLWLRDPETNHKTVMEGQYALPEFEYLASCNWVFTEKVDGTNMRLFTAEDAAVPYIGKTDAANVQPNLVAAMDDALGKLRSVLDGNFVCYGEGYGAGIQKGGTYGPPSFVLFDIAAITEEGLLFLERGEVEDIAGRAGVAVVPVIGTGTLDDMNRIVKDGFQSQWGDFRAEGIVARPAVEMRNHRGRRIIAKLKCKDFPK